MKSIHHPQTPVENSPSPSKPALKPISDFASFQSIKNNLVKSCQDNEDGPANNLRQEGVCFHREPANIGKISDNFFLNRTMIFRLRWRKQSHWMVSRLVWMGWGCSPLVFEDGGWISCRLACYWRICIYILIYYRTVKGCYSAVFTNAGLYETSHLQHITTTTTTNI